MIKVKFLPQNTEVVVKKGTDLLSAAALAGVPLEGDCGGKGTCGKCKVKVDNYNPEETTPAERKYLSEKQLANGLVLACQRKVYKDTTIELIFGEDAYQGKSSLKGRLFDVKPEPPLEKIVLQLKKPETSDQTPDLERLLTQLKRDGISVNLCELAGLPLTMRQENFLVTAVISGNRLITVEPGNTSEKMFGLAFDIGTTTIMGSLLDLQSGDTIETAAVTNPQQVYGADVISRIIYASAGKKELKQIQKKVITALNDIIKTLTDISGVKNEEIYEAVVVGNTTMSHLFLGIDPQNLARAPFVPAYQQMVEVRASELGLQMHQGGRVMVLPNLACFIGSDTIGMILATNLDLQNKNVLAIDIGTNGELVLAAGGKILACSTAAGPAFEGANIKHGMRAANGAIESVLIDKDGVVNSNIIGGLPARGICGSGLIDAVAELLKADLIEPSGRFIKPDKTDTGPPDNLIERLRRTASGLEFVLVSRENTEYGEDIVITQSDLRELQLAKGAIFAGLKILLTEAGITIADLDRVLLAGAFGNYIRLDSAASIGLLPRINPERLIAVGNAAGDGATFALISKKIRKRAEEIPQKVEYIELSTRADFQKELMGSLDFKTYC